MKIDAMPTETARQTLAREGIRAIREELGDALAWTKERWPAAGELHAAIGRMAASAAQLDDNFDYLQRLFRDHAHCLGKVAVHEFAQRVGFCSPRESLCMIAGFLEEIRDQLTWRES